MSYKLLKEDGDVLLKEDGDALLVEYIQAFISLVMQLYDRALTAELYDRTLELKTRGERI